MNVAICEDEMITAETLKNFVSDFMTEKNIKTNVEIFQTADEFFRSTETYDLLLLDYSLPDSNGMEIAQKLRRENKRTIIIFITAYSEHVFKSFEVNTFRYLLKPVDEDELRHTLTAFLNNFETYSRIEVPLTNGVVFVSLPEIMYIESSGRYTTVRLNSTTYTSTKPLSSFEAEINSYKFYRTHRTFIVNMKYISDVNNNLITLTNGEKVSISRRNLSAFQKSYMNFLKYSDL